VDFGRLFEAIVATAGDGMPAFAALAGAQDSRDALFTEDCRLVAPVGYFRESQLATAVDATLHVPVSIHLQRHSPTLRTSRSSAEASSGHSLFKAVQTLSGLCALVEHFI